VGVAADLRGQPRRQARVALPQLDPGLLGQVHQLRPGPLVKARIGRVSDGLLHHRRVDRDLIQALVLDGAGLAAGLDGLGQQPLDTFLANALAPAGERSRIDGRLVLKEGLPGDVLVIRVLDPARDHRLVRKPEGVLQIEQARHQPRRGRGAACRRGEEPRPLRLEELPVDEGCKLHQLMTHIDQVDEPRAEKIVLLGRAWAVLHRRA
jgi:hypothetical protein